MAWLRHNWLHVFVSISELATIQLQRPDCSRSARFRIVR